MSGKKYNLNSDDGHSGESVTPQGSSSAPSIPVPVRATTPRSATTKGTLFTNLGEAHHAITSRLASRSAARGIQDTSPQALPGFSINTWATNDSTGSHGKLPSTRQPEPGDSIFPVHEQCSASLAGPKSPAPVSNNPFIHSSPPEFQFRGSPDLSSSTDTNLNGSANNPHSVRVPSETESSVGAIYEHYMPSRAVDSPTPSEDSFCGTVRGPSQSDNESRHLDVTYRGAQKDSIERHHSIDQWRDIPSPSTKQGTFGVKAESHRRPMFSPAGEAPRIPVPELPRVRQDIKHSVTTFNERFRNTPASHPAESDDRFEEWHGDANPGIQRHEIGTALTYPIATRAPGYDSYYAQSNTGHCGQNVVGHDEQLFPDTHGHVSHASSENDTNQDVASNPGLSAGDCPSESDEDPFRYDRGSLTIFLKPSREREVSVALHCLGEDSTIGSMADEQTSSPIGPPTPLPPFFSPTVPGQNGGIRIQSNNPFFSRLQSYQTPAATYEWDDDDNLSQVKVTVRLPPVPPNSPILPTTNSGEATRKSPAGPHADKFQSILSDGADWETVADTVGQFDSNRAFASSMGLSAYHSVQVTGSSIADYSDTSSAHPDRFKGFESTERILQHPTASSGLGSRHHRTLKDRPIFPPKPRIHRVNGYLQNSCRIATDPTTGSSGTSARSHLVEKLSASIRSRSTRKHEQERNRYHNLEHLSNSGSLDSSFSGNGGQASTATERKEARNPQGNDTTPAETSKTDTSWTGDEEQEGSQRPLSNVTVWPGVTPAPKAHTRQQGGQVSFGPGSPTLFDFPLISLEEAARRQALRRLQNDDITVTSGTRTRNDSSVLSRATQRTTPPTPYIAKPLPAHRWRPPPAGFRSSDTTHRGYAGRVQRSNFVRSERGISGIPLFKTRSHIPAPSDFSHSHRNTLESFTTTWRSRPSYAGRPSTIDSPRLFGQDKRNHARAVNLTADLRQIVNLETATHFGVISEDAYLSWEARRRRQTYYYVMCVLCIFPFMAPLVYRGTFNSALSWYTKGETGHLSRQQRRNVLILGTIVSAVWLVALAVFVTLAVNGKQKSHL